MPSNALPRLEIEGWVMMLSSTCRLVWKEDKQKTTIQTKPKTEWNVRTELKANRIWRWAKNHHHSPSIFFILSSHSFFILWFFGKNKYLCFLAELFSPTQTNRYLLLLYIFPLSLYVFFCGMASVMEKVWMEEQN